MTQMRITRIIIKDKIIVIRESSTTFIQKRPKLGRIKSHHKKILMKDFHEQHRIKPLKEKRKSHCKSDRVTYGCLLPKTQILQAMGTATLISAAVTISGGTYSSSSFGGWIVTRSGSGVLGPCLPLGSQSSIILTLIPSTPC